MSAILDYNREKGRIEKFQKELTTLLNKYSVDVDTQTPDYILSEILCSNISTILRLNELREKHNGEEKVDFKLNLHSHDTTSSYGKAQTVNQQPQPTVRTMPTGTSTYSNGHPTLDSNPEAFKGSSFTLPTEDFLRVKAALDIAKKQEEEERQLDENNKRVIGGLLGKEIQEVTKGNQTQVSKIIPVPFFHEGRRVDKCKRQSLRGFLICNPEYEAFNREDLRDREGYCLEYYDGKRTWVPNLDDITYTSIEGVSAAESLAEDLRDLNNRTKHTQTNLKVNFETASALTEEFLRILRTFTDTYPPTKKFEESEVKERFKVGSLVMMNNLSKILDREPGLNGTIWEVIEPGEDTKKLNQLKEGLYLRIRRNTNGRVLDIHSDYVCQVEDRRWEMGRAI